MEKSLNKIKPQERAPSMVMKKNLSRAPAREWYKRWWGILLIIIGLYFLVSLVIFAIMGEKLTSLNQEGDISLVGREQVSKEQLYLHTDDDPNWGTPEAPLQIIEFSDFQCSFCQRAHETLQKLVDDYRGQVAWVYKHFPIVSLHPIAVKVSEASECAAEQGKFWEYANELYKNQSLINENYLSELADQLNLNVSKFDKCLTSGKYNQRVNDNQEEGLAAGINGTPGIYVNDQLIKGALPYESFKQVIDSILTK